MQNRIVYSNTIALLHPSVEAIPPEQRKRMLMLEQLKRVKKNRHKYFIPNGRGEEFLTVLGSLDPFITLYSAANGVGKTATAVNAIAEICYPTPGGHPWIKGPLFTDFPFLKRIRIVSDPSVVESIIKEMKHWFPVGRYVTSKGRSAYDKYWKTDTGFDIDIMTYDQDQKDFESANLGLVWLDEPPPINIYKACIARLRRGGRLFITATPLEGSEWMYDEIFASTTNTEGRRAIVEAVMEDACKIHGVRGHLEHHNIELIIAQYSEEEKQARVYGKFAHLTGLIYKQFSPNIHIIPPFQLTKKDYAVYHYLDPHPRTPDAGLWVAVDRRGTCFVVDELFLKCLGGDSELATRLQEKNDHYRIISRKIDPSACIEDQHRQKSLQQVLADYGIHYEPASKKREAADRALGNALDYVKVGDSMLKAPKLYIFSTCVRLIWELQHYRWDNWRGKMAQIRTPKAKPVDKDDHMIENLGRAMLDDPMFLDAVDNNAADEDTAPNDDPY